jgi:pimeloyl-ACP methyl ester carboxylesterase
MPRFDQALKRTTVRSLFSGLQAFSPTLAAELAAVAMFRTTRRRGDAWEADVSARAERLWVEGPTGRIAVQRWGHGPLVVLAHGWNGRATQLAGFVEPLVDAGYQVVAFDAPGHGDSAGNTSSMLEFARAFSAVVDSVRPFFQPLAGIIAHSMGGAAVTLALSRACEGTQSTESTLGAPRLVFIAPPIDVRDFVVTVSSELGLSEPTRHALERVVEKRVGERIDDLHAVPLARNMTAPLLVIHDEQDRAVPVECGAALAGAWPGAEITRTQGLGHNRILRDPQAIARAVAFVRGATTRVRSGD